MKNALMLTAIWLGILVTAYAIVYWDQGIEQPLPISVLEQEPAMEVPVFSDPSQVLNVPVPEDWTVANEAASVQLAPVDGALKLWIVPTEALDAETAFMAALDEAGIVIAWENLEVRLAEGPEDEIQATIGYAADGGRQILGWLVIGEGPAAVVLAFGEMDALVDYGGEIEEVLDGLIAPELVPVLI